MADQELIKKINSKIGILKLIIDDLRRENIQQKPTEGSYENHYFHRRQT